MIGLIVTGPAGSGKKGLVYVRFSFSGLLP